jgi:hypothetical protein
VGNRDKYPHLFGLREFAVTGGLVREGYTEFVKRATAALAEADFRHPLSEEDKARVEAKLRGLPKRMREKMLKYAEASNG